MQKKEKYKDSFLEWAYNNGIETNQTIVQSAFPAILPRLGISLSSLYDETDALKIRLIASDLVIKRKQCNTTYKEYVQALELLVTYAEYLETKDVFVSARVQSTKDKTRDSLTVALYLSRANEKALRKLGYKTYSEAFKELAIILDQKPATIKNMRDEFDPYFNNGRVGWYQRELKGSRKEIFEKYKDVSNRDLSAIVIQMLAIYNADKC